MSVDLWMLVVTGLLCLGLPLIYAVGRDQVQGGLRWAFGDRETPLEVPAGVSRAVRAHQNLIENLTPFAILVLVTQVAGKANAVTACGATFFFWGRVAHALIYTAGYRYLRPAAYFAAAAGALLIMVQLFN